MKFYCRQQMSQKGIFGEILPPRWEVVTEDDTLLAIVITEELAIFFMGCLEDQFGED